MEEATRLRESATDVQEAVTEIEGYLQRLRDMAIEVRNVQSVRNQEKLSIDVICA